jgi:hypothetical protein
MDTLYRLLRKNDRSQLCLWCCQIALVSRRMILDRAWRGGSKE